MVTLYTFSMIFLITNLILIKKSDKKMNILEFIGLLIGLIFCYNTFLCYVLTFFVIPVTLTNLSIINIVIAIILLFVILRKKEIQKYEFHKVDLIYVIIIAGAILLMAYLNFGFPFNIKYETGDPSVHYLTSTMFEENDSLLIEQDDEIYGSFNTRKAMSYVNSGLLMKCFSGIVNEFDFYKIFILFGIFILFITAMVMYAILSRFSKDNKTKFLAFLVSLIYTMGYPLNSFLFGFEYLNMGIFILELIFLAVNYYKNEEMDMPVIVVTFALLNFGLFCAYYMFVPFIYSSLWLYFCKIGKEREKTIFNKKTITLLITTLLIPFFLGFVYHLAPEAYSILINKFSTNDIFKYSSHIVGEGLAKYGYIYVNLYSNIIVLLPIAIYVIAKKYKENSFACMSFIFAIVFIEILLVGFIIEKVSMYYLSKNYFALWFILFYLNYIGLIEIYKKYPKVAFGIVGGYIILIVLNLTFVNTPLKNEEINSNERPTNVVEVFGVNKTILNEREIDLYKEELEILKYFKDNIGFEKKVELIGNSEQGYWSYALTKYVQNEKGILSQKGQFALDVKMLRTKYDIYEADYIIYFNRTKRYKSLKDIIHSLGDIIFSNEYGGIVKCKE